LVNADWREKRAAAICRAYSPLVEGEIKGSDPFSTESLVENEVPQPDAGDAQEADEAIEEGKTDD